jgi:tripartite-type tricarboxylate transporter receptor subunit TctC
LTKHLEDYTMLPRRRFLRLAANIAAVPLVLRISWAEDYPTRPVRIVIGFAPGGGADIAGRLVAQWLSARLGQQFIVENRPGAGANIAMEAVAKAAPDGYTLLLVSPGAAINATLYDKLTYNFIRDFALVSGFLRVPNLMVVNPSIPAKTVPEFIAYTRANPGKVNMASAGSGSSVHVSGELFKIMAGVDMIHVPYRGSGPMLSDLLGGQVQVAFPDIGSSIEHVRSGKLRALAVTTVTRSEALPEIPTVAEFLPAYEASNWWGVAAPKNTPVEIVNKLNSEINAASADPKMKARLADLSGMSLAGSPADFGKLIAEETDKWGKVIRAAKIKPE